MSSSNQIKILQNPLYSMRPFLFDFKPFELSKKSLKIDISLFCIMIPLFLFETELKSNFIRSLGSARFLNTFYDKKML